MMNVMKKGTVCLTCVCLAGYAMIPVSAISSTTLKEEVVYVTTLADGTVDNMNVVNIFDAGNVVDYGNYSSVKMLTTNDPITQVGDRISFSSNQKVYYQGTLKEQQRPWNISIRYFLDHQEYDAKDIVGKTGALEMRISITKNENCDGSYFDDYALQSTVTLDTQLCSHIVAKDATIANVGSDKQLVYTVLPNQGLDTSIYADVVDFQMDAITFNGMKLNMNIDIDEDEWVGYIEDLSHATNQLHNGSSSLLEGLNSLKSGTQSVYKGSNTLSQGVHRLDNGLETLNEGTSSLQEGLEMLQLQSPALTQGSYEMKSALQTIQARVNDMSLSTDQLNQLVTSSKQIRESIHQLSLGMSELNKSVNYDSYQSMMSSNGLNIASIQNNNQAMIQQSQQQIHQLQSTIASLQEQGVDDNQIQVLQDEVTYLQQMIQLLQANQATMYATKEYISQVSTSAQTLNEGMSTLDEKYQQFDEGILEMVSLLNDLTSNMNELTNAFNLVVEHYDDFDTGLNQYVEAIEKINQGCKSVSKGVSDLALGSQELVDGSDDLSSYMKDVYQGTTNLSQGATQLNQGTQTFHQEVSSMSETIQQEIDDVLTSLQGNQTKTESFTSSKNTNVKSVQFVIKTTAIEKEKESVVQKSEKESLSLWERILDLFKF